MYILLNRENVVVDILENIRYIKLQSSNGIVVACEENEGTGVIGSDCDTHYTLVKADTQNSPNAIRVLEVDEIPSKVKPNVYKLDEEAEEIEFVYRYTLDEAKAMKQEENRTQFAKYLASHPITWVDGKQYGITEQDQSEIVLKLSQFDKTNDLVLEWHAKHEEDVTWDYEDLISLNTEIARAVYPIYHAMQQFKTSIYNSKSIEELENIQITFE